MIYKEINIVLGCDTAQDLNYNVCLKPDLYCGIKFCIESVDDSAMVKKLIDLEFDESQIEYLIEGLQASLEELKRQNESE